MTLNKEFLKIIPILKISIRIFEHISIVISLFYHFYEHKSMHILLYYEHKIPKSTNPSTLNILLLLKTHYKFVFIEHKVFGAYKDRMYLIKTTFLFSKLIK